MISHWQCYSIITSDHFGLSDKGRIVVDVVVDKWALASGAVISSKCRYPSLTVQNWSYGHSIALSDVFFVFMLFSEEYDTLISNVWREWFILCLEKCHIAHQIYFLFYENNFLDSLLLKTFSLVKGNLGSRACSRSRGLDFCCVFVSSSGNHNLFVRGSKDSGTYRSPLRWAITSRLFFLEQSVRKNWEQKAERAI